jgi:hypothetical protein
MLKSIVIGGRYSWVTLSQIRLRASINGNTSTGRNWKLGHECTARALLKRTLSLDDPRNPGTNVSWKHHSGWTPNSRKLTRLLKRLLELQQLLPFWRQENTKGFCRYSDLEPSLFSQPTSGFPIKRKSRGGSHITFCSPSASQRKLPAPTVRRRRLSGA